MTDGPSEPPTPLSAGEQEFLRALARVLLSLPREFDHDLRREQGMAFNDYLTLMHLSEAPDRNLQMSYLAEQCGLTLSGVTRVMTRLEHNGWVRRETSPSDRRITIGAITEEGLRRLEQAWPTHLASVRKHVADRLTGRDLRELTDALRCLTTSTDP